MAERRRRPSRLTTEEIVAAARSLIEEQGVEACTMRPLAARLAVQPPALYRRVRDKDELLALVLDDVMGDIAFPEVGPWQDQLAETMRRLRALFTVHPNLLALHLRSHPHGPNGIRFVEAVSAPLLAAGFSEEDAAFAISTLTTYTLGLTLFRSSLAWGVPPGALRAALRRAEPSSAQRVLEETLRTDMDAVFEFGLLRIIEGLAASRPG